MASGKVKWSDNTNGFGFIAQEAGRDGFANYTTIVGGQRTLVEGEEVGFEVANRERRLKVQNVRHLKLPPGAERLRAPARQ